MDSYEKWATENEIYKIENLGKSYKSKIEQALADPSIDEIKQAISVSVLANPDFKLEQEINEIFIEQVLLSFIADRRIKQTKKHNLKSATGKRISEFDIRLFSKFREIQKEIKKGIKADEYLKSQGDVSIFNEECRAVMMKLLMAITEISFYILEEEYKKERGWQPFIDRLQVATNSAKELLESKGK